MKNYPSITEMYSMPHEDVIKLRDQLKDVVFDFSQLLMLASDRNDILLSDINDHAMAIISLQASNAVIQGNLNRKIADQRIKLAANRLAVDPHFNGN